MEGDDPGKESPAEREKLRKEAVEAVAKADAAIVVVGRSPKLESEDFDIKSLDLPAGQDELIEAVAKVNKNTVVVINAGGPVIMSRWIEKVPAIVDMWYGGQEGGNAIADILFGDANPSGKLPVSFVKRWEDSPAYGHYPGENLTGRYAEGIYVGYRYFDKHNVDPLFPFGYGLSYTKFDYSDLKVSPEPSLAAQTGRSEPAGAQQWTTRRRGSRRTLCSRWTLECGSPHPGTERLSSDNLAPGETKNVAFLP